ncbi:MAG: type II secretion system protein [Armatimonadota bacterium]
MKSRAMRGFTLIELLVVIAIISMLASMIMPVYSKAREKARQTVCVSNQHQIGLAIIMFIQDHDETLPDSATIWSEMITNYGVNEKVLICPTKGKSLGNGYLYNNAISSVALGDIPNPVRTLMTIDGIHEPTSNPHTYGNILYTAQDVDLRHNTHAVCGFVDGHVGLETEIMGFEYTNDFEQPVGGEWSLTQIDTTPTGGRKFLGQFTNDSATLTLSALPDHEKITVAFDLFLIRSWDGNNSTNGPDEWDLRVQGGQALIHTTFGMETSSPGQAYPGSFPGATNPLRTGAVANDSLGYLYNGTPMDSTYHLTYTFEHTGGNLRLVFSASGLEDISNESWGIDNIQVSGE